MTENPDTTERLDRLESIVEGQAATIDALCEQVAKLDGDGTVDGGESRPSTSRRTALKAGGLAGLLALGVGTAGADPQGQVGTAADPVATLYAEALDGGITGGTTVSNLTGTGLDVQGGALAVPDDGIAGLQIDLESIAGWGLSVEADRLRSGGTALPRYDAVGDDPAAVVDAMAETFTAERTWADSDPSFGYRSGPAHGEVDTAFSGAVVAPTGEVVFAPYGSDNVGVYDPVGDTYTSGANHGEGDSAFRGAAVAPTGEVVFAPHISDYVGVYDPVSDTYTRGASHGEGVFAFSGAAVAPTGEVIFAPYNSDYVGVYDPVSDTFTRGASHGEGGTAFRGAAVAPTGAVVFAPRDSDNVGVYDPVSDTYTPGASHGEGGRAFRGAAVAPTGDVIFAPYQSPNVGVYDPVSDTYTSGDSHGEGIWAFSGATVAPTGEVIFAPLESSNVGVYDPVSDTYTSDAHGEGGTAFRGAAMAPTGEVVFAPHFSANVGVVTTNGRALSLETALHPLVNNS